MSGCLDVEQRGGVLIATLNNPERLNALSLEVLQGLDELVCRLEVSDDIRAVVLTATGLRVFCAGADIKAWGHMDSAQFSRDWIALGHRLLDRLARVPVPIITAITGDVLGGGLELAAACDLRISNPNAVFALPEAGIGVTPGWSGLQRVMRLMPEPILREMALSCRKMPASRLHTVGFINELASDPLERALEIANDITRLAPRAVSINKQVLNAAAGEGREAVIDWLAGGLVAQTEDRMEGIASFREKRPPKFTGS